MAKQLITIGTPGAGGGEPAHAAFKKINDNTNEVYSFLGAEGSGVLTAEGAREALGIYSKDEVYSREEVYSKNEVDNFIDELPVLEGGNTWGGDQQVNGSLNVAHSLTVGGLNIFGIGHNYIRPARAKDVRYYNTTNRAQVVYAQCGPGNGTFSLTVTDANADYLVDNALREWVWLSLFVPPGASYIIAGSSNIVNFFIY